MKMKTFARSAAFASLVLASGAAFGQGAIGGQGVPEEAVDSVRQYCTTLAEADAAGSTADIRVPNELTSGIDFSEITLEQCRASGFLER